MWQMESHTHRWGDCSQRGAQLIRLEAVNRFPLPQQKIKQILAPRRVAPLRVPGSTEDLPVSFKPAQRSHEDHRPADELLFVSQSCLSVPRKYLSCLIIVCS